MKFILEEERNTPVFGEYDVVVAGGGMAGISAALAAARTGAKKVLLLEKQYGLGGLATLGLVTIFLPICDGMGRQVCFGICEELFRLSIQEGHERLYPSAWLEGGCVEERRRQRFAVQYNPNVFSILAEQLLLSEGVEILYGTSVCGVKLHGNSVGACLIENKSGRAAIIGRAFVDATGDADIFLMTGSETVLSKRKNPLAAWYYQKQGELLTLNQLGACDMPSEMEEANQSERLEGRHYIGLDAQELSEMMIDTHSALLKDFLKKGNINSERSLTLMPSIPQVRMTRMIKGVSTLEDVPFKTHDDSIGMIGDWRRRGPVFEIAFSSLHNGKIANLITAGRSISVTDAMWDITRTIPGCAVTGQAAGTAAALTDDFGKLDIGRLQNELKGAGSKLHISEL